MENPAEMAVATVMVQLWLQWHWNMFCLAEWRHRLNGLKSMPSTPPR